MQVDYDEIAEDYDQHRRGKRPYIDTLAGLLDRCGGRRVLELGAGTGNSTEALHDTLPCEVTALEPSDGMICQARAKGVPARWVRGAGPAFPFADACFDFVFATYVLHHIHDLSGLLDECARVLERGCAAFLTAPASFIVAHPMNAYFPSFAKVDLARFQRIEAVEAGLRSAGFRAVGSAKHVAAPVPVDAAYVARVAGKFISTYALLPPEEFESGLRRLRADVAAKGELDTPVVWEAVMVWGFQ